MLSSDPDQNTETGLFADKNPGEDGLFYAKNAAYPRSAGGSRRIILLECRPASKRRIRCRLRAAKSGRSVAVMRLPVFDAAQSQPGDILEYDPNAEE